MSCSLCFSSVSSTSNALSLLPEQRAYEEKNCVISPLLKNNQMDFFCISAFGRGLTYSNCLVILSQRHRNLYSMELPSKISFSLFWLYAKNYSLVTAVSVGMVYSSQQPEGLLQLRLLTHPSETSVIILFYRRRE